MLMSARIASIGYRRVSSNWVSFCVDAFDDNDFIEDWREQLKVMVGVAGEYTGGSEWRIEIICEHSFSIKFTIFKVLLNM